MNIGINAIYLEGKRTGVGRYLFNLLSYWAKYYSQHKYYLYFKNEVPKDKFLEEPCFVKKVLKAPRFFEKWIFWENLILLPQILKEQNLHVFFSPGYTLPFYTGRLKTAVAVFDIFYTAHPEWVPLRNRYTLGPLSQFSSRKADCILTASLFDRDEIIKHYRVPADKIKVIYLAAEEKFKEAQDLVELKKVLTQYGIKGRYLLCVGHIINRRMQDKLIRAFFEFHKKYKDITLIIVGQNKSYPYMDIERQIHDLGIGDAVKVISYLPEKDLVFFYGGATAFIYISLYEGESIPLKEAMAAGVPVITSPLLQEVTGEAGNIVQNPQDIRELKDVLETVAFDEKLRQKMSSKGRERVNMFSWEKCAQETLEAIRGVCDTKE